MVQYQKFMFDNFVISCDDDQCVAEPLDTEEIQNEEPLPAAEETNSAETEVKTTAEETVEEEVSAAEPEPEPAEKETPPPGYSQDELDAAVKSAEERGYEKGFNAASGENQKLQQNMLEEIGTRLMTLVASQEDARREDEQAALRLAVGVVRKLLPSLEESVARQEVGAFLEDNFADFRREKSLSFSFHPDMAAEVAPLLSKLAEKNDFEGKIAVHKDINLGLSDCRVEWRNGGVERNTAEVLDKVEGLLK